MHMTGKNRYEWRVAWRMMCAMALLLLSFAHQPVIRTDFAPLNLSAYLLPDGSLPILCFTASNYKDGKFVDNGPCQACRLAASITIPVAPDISLRLPAIIHAVQAIPRAIHLDFPVLQPATRPRAPPVPV